MQDRKLSVYCCRPEYYLLVFKAFQTFHHQQHITVSWNNWIALIQCERFPMTSKLSYFRMHITAGDKYWSSPVLALPEFLLCTALHLLSLWGISTWPYETDHAGNPLSSSVCTCIFRSSAEFPSTCSCSLVIQILLIHPVASRDFGEVELACISVVPFIIPVANSIFLFYHFLYLCQKFLVQSSLVDGAPHWRQLGVGSPLWALVSVYFFSFCWCLFLFYIFFINTETKFFTYIDLLWTHIGSMTTREWC